MLVVSALWIPVTYVVGNQHFSLLVLIGFPTMTDYTRELQHLLPECNVSLEPGASPLSASDRDKFVSEQVKQALPVVF